MTIAIAFLINIFLYNFIPDISWCIGHLTTKGEEIFRRTPLQTKAQQIIAGAILTLSITISVIIFVFFLMFASHILHKYVEFVVETLLYSTVFRIGKTNNICMGIFRAVVNDDLETAKMYLLELDHIAVADNKEKVIKTTIIYIAKNINDGIVAPIFFMLIGGVPMAFLYRVIDSIDSVIGHTNERYIYFGRFVAKVDDLLNFVPARLSAMFISFSTKILDYNYDNAINIFWRDRDKIAGLKNGQVQSVMVGALEISFGSDEKDFYTYMHNPKIGEDIKVVECNDIKKAIKIMYCTAIVVVIIVSGLKIIF